MSKKKFGGSSNRFSTCGEQLRSQSVLMSGKNALVFTDTSLQNVSSILISGQKSSRKAPELNTQINSNRGVEES